MIGAMETGTNAVLQFKLPFEGVQDRVRAAAEAGNVLMLAEARRAMLRDDISDILIIRALKRSRLLGKIHRGDGQGVWRCRCDFNVKGFRDGGSLALLISEGRVLVEDIHWDHSHEH